MECAEFEMLMVYPMEVFTGGERHGFVVLTLYRSLKNRSTGIFIQIFGWSVFPDPEPSVA